METNGFSLEREIACLLTILINFGFLFFPSRAISPFGERKTDLPVAVARPMVAAPPSQETVTSLEVKKAARTVGRVEPRVVVKIPWARVRCQPDRDAKESVHHPQRRRCVKSIPNDDDVGMDARRDPSQWNGEGGENFDRTRRKRRHHNNEAEMRKQGEDDEEEELENGTKKTAKPVRKAKRKTPKGGEDGGEIGEINFPTSPSTLHFPDQTERENAGIESEDDEDDDVSRRKRRRQQQRQNKNQVQQFQITDTLPEHFKLALRERLSQNERPIVVPRLVDTPKKAKRQERRRSGAGKRIAIADSEWWNNCGTKGEQHRGTGLEQRAINPRTTNGDHPLSGTDRIVKTESDSGEEDGVKVINPLKLIRRFVPGTNQEEYKIGSHGLKRSIKSEPEENNGTSADVVDLVSDDEDEDVSVLTSSAAVKTEATDLTYLKKRMPLLNVSIVGQQESPRKETGEEEASLKEVGKKSVVISLKRLTDKEIAGFMGENGCGDKGQLAPKSPFSGHKDMRGFNDLFLSRSAPLVASNAAFKSSILRPSTLSASWTTKTDNVFATQRSRNDNFGRYRDEKTKMRDAIKARKARNNRSRQRSRSRSESRNGRKRKNSTKKGAQHASSRGEREIAFDVDGFSDDLHSRFQLADCGEDERGTGGG